jgi:hypothetical protein
LISLTAFHTACPYGWGFRDSDLTWRFLPPLGITGGDGDWCTGGKGWLRRSLATLIERVPSEEGLEAASFAKSCLT